MPMFRSTCCRKQWSIFNSSSFLALTNYGHPSIRRRDVRRRLCGLKRASLPFVRDFLDHASRLHPVTPITPHLPSNAISDRISANLADPCSYQLPLLDSLGSSKVSGRFWSISYSLATIRSALTTHRPGPETYECRRLRLSFHPHVSTSVPGCLLTCLLSQNIYEISRFLS